MSNLQGDLTHYEGQLEQLKREGTTKAESGRASEKALQTKVNQMQGELQAAGLVLVFIIF